MGWIGSLAMAPDGRTVYAVSQSDEGVAVLRRDAASGALRQLRGPGGCVLRRSRLGCAAAEGLGSGALVSPDGRHVYVFSVGEGPTITGFARRPSGSLARLSGPTGCLAGRPRVDAIWGVWSRRRSVAATLRLPGGFTGLEHR